MRSPSSRHRRPVIRLATHGCLDRVLLLFRFLVRLILGPEVADQTSESAVLRLELVIRPLLDDSSVVHGDDMVDMRQKVEGVGDEDPRLARKRTLDGIEEDSSAHSGVEGRQRIVQCDDVGVEVQRSGDVDTLFLSAG